MTLASMTGIPRASRRVSAAALLAAALLAAAAIVPAIGGAQADSARRSGDPRVGLRGGLHDAAVAARNLAVVAHRPRPARFFDPADPGNFAFANSDLAFQGRRLFQGGYNGFQVWNVANPARPRLEAWHVCPGGQGDLSVHGNLLFMSVEQTSGRVDCGGQGVADTVSTARFRGVRIFDIRDIRRPRQVAAVQTCRGSHTHTLVTDPRDAAHVYVYVQGTSSVRPAGELAGCSARPPHEDPNTSYFRIEVIRVPLAAPERAAIVSTPRIFADSSGNIAGLWKGGEHGPGTQSTATTDQCHDITAYPALGLAAGACSGNGILLDISDPANPRRIDEVSDPNFAYWHSATFANDGSTVVFTDEWGGGTAPRCRSTDRPEWGANAFFTLTNRRLEPVGYWKLPAAQTAQENCVAHNGSLVPVPGRDIFVQAWYQGGITVIDFTDPARPVEIAYFDRGPVDSTKLTLGGHWSAYWYNGYIYGSEIARGLDVLQLTPSEHLSANEIAAARLVAMTRHNPQLQQRLEWPARFVVARAYADQLARSPAVDGAWTAALARELDAAERRTGASRRAALARLATRLEGEAAGSGDEAKVRALAGVVRRLASPAR